MECLREVIRSEERLSVGEVKVKCVRPNGNGYVIRLAERVLVWLQGNFPK